ncbi:GT-D fold domain-containing protein [Terribacillus saccharophilus]|uniref:GT-D fold domain-containing protein n=1 Tax=Terribacillus saccharophilus TaxID=361277 RepID=UPI002DC52842|nr:hypothetical protein [Terribacillus saccharophilus]
MDNDSFFKKELSKKYRKLKFYISNIGRNVCSEDDGNDLISQKIQSGKPFMAVRLGAVESRSIEKWMSNKPPTFDNLQQIKYAAGVFPNDKETIEEFCHVYTDALKDSDIVGLWGVVGERKITRTFCPEASYLPLRSLEPYYYAQPWSQFLKGKRVLIVHPFIDSISDQYLKRQHVFENRKVLPKFKELSLVKAVQTNGGGKTNFNSWFDSLAYMKNEISKYDFDIAIIGAGAYGLPLASFVKSQGKQAIQMGGSAQILFGIKGKRWDNHQIISKMYNEHWVRPLPTERPPEAEKVEGGSYW